MNKQSTLKFDFDTRREYPSVSGFDFGDFAIILTYDDHEGGQFSTYYGDKELQEYKQYLARELKLCGEEKAVFRFTLPQDVVNVVRNRFREWRKVPCGELFSLLERCVPRDILPKYFRG